ncbi:MAG: hypothetical protein HC860_16190 [Alkalinema sp. RU_4_3]|nr:hypothetical protein [Alkalinema sp. RU_4_3]
MTDPKNLQVIERRQRAVELRKSGMTLEQVADQIAADPRFGVPNYGASSAYDDVRRALDQQAMCNFFRHHKSARQTEATPFPACG